MARRKNSSPQLSPVTGYMSLRRGRARISLFAVALCLVAAGLFGGVAWIAATGDPLGGEPVLHIAIDPGEIAPALAQAASPGAAASRAPSAPSRVAGQRIAGPSNASYAAPAATDAPPAGSGPAAPIPSLLEQARVGYLPVISEDGMRPDEAYARPFATQNRGPFIGLVVGGLGLNRATTAAAIERLPPEVSLAFVPYADNLESWASQARAEGHELLIELPMEPFDYPANDPGPYTLLTSVAEPENLRRLEWLMSRFTGYFAATNYLGAKFSTSHTSLKPVLRALEQRGVSYIDTGSSQRSVLDIVARNVDSRYAVADRIVDARISPDEIDAKLLELEALALQSGHALGRATAFPVTIETVERWARGLERRGYRLAPASAILKIRREAALLESAALPAERP